jgi:hypothetical protein
MLRNNLKIKICGLVIILLITGCSSTRLLLRSPVSHTSNKNIPIKFKAEPYYEYKLRDIIERYLNACSINMQNYNISIEVKETESQIAFSEKDILKEQKRISAKVEIYDREYNEISSTLLDSSSTYEVNDNYPYAGISSKKASTESVLLDLGNNIALYIASVANTN